MMLLLTGLRVVLPPGRAIGAFAAIYTLFEGFHLFMFLRFGQVMDAERLSLYLLRVGALIYGSWRVTGFHPAFRNDYRIWLERSPWTARKPLPAGPIALSWEDALPLAALALLGRTQGPSAPMVVLGLFLIGYLALLAIPSFTTGAAASGYAIAFLVGLAIRCWPDPRAFLAAAVLGYLAGWLGLRASLARFPWPLYEKFNLATTKDMAQEATCGWPFDQLQPNVRATRILPAHAGVLISLLAGWYLFAAESLLGNPADRQTMIHLTFVNAVLFLAGGRLVVYCWGYAAPISFWGRLATLRPIVPGYDQVFLAPLCTAMVGFLALDRFRPPGLVDDVFLPIALAVACLVALTTGPSLARWRLTGRHRITPGFATKNDIVKVG